MAKKPEKKEKREIKKESQYLSTNISGFDKLIDSGGFERGTSILVSGGCGTGKSIFSLEFLYNGCKQGQKGLYMGFEENPEQFKKWMEKFNMDLEKYEKEGLLRIIKLDPYKIARTVNAILVKEKKELKIEGELSILPKNFQPDRVVIDSLSTLSAAFENKKEHYEIYVKELLNLLSSKNAVTLAIYEIEQSLERYNRTGMEESLTDGVVVLYNIKKESTRVRMLEILKLKGTNHLKGVVPFEIKEKIGIVVYPSEKIF